jgi:UDP-N-acetylglucosamine 4,6-dehydratase/5-epimerase
LGDRFAGKVILLTGGTGSFGQRFTEILLKKHRPAAVRIYSRGEHKQVEMEGAFGSEKLRFFIGDVRDSVRLHRAMDGVDIVVHAAALKHVPVCEYNPIEAVRTNINGAENVINAAIDQRVEKVIAISTDKAVHPVNLYGATKLVSEKLFVQANSYSGRKKTRFSCVRYGNVVGSNGSVIPLFMKQKERGELTITDERMTRFWITLDQGAGFVLKCLEEMRGGEIFVPKIPSVKITELADQIAPGARRKIIGIRAGEKLHEILLTSDEARHSADMGDMYVVLPEHKFWKSGGELNGKKLPGNFTYSSDMNNQWLSPRELKALINEDRTG